MNTLARMLFCLLLMPASALALDHPPRNPEIGVVYQDSQVFFVFDAGASGRKVALWSLSVLQKAPQLPMWSILRHKSQRFSRLAYGAHPRGFKVEGKGTLQENVIYLVDAWGPDISTFSEFMLCRNPARDLELKVLSRGGEHRKTVRAASAACESGGES